MKRDGNMALLLPRYEHDVCDDCPQMEREIKVSSESMKIVQVWITRSNDMWKSEGYSSILIRSS